ncbi:MAG TPA: AAA family ATPase [Streptosporangiaceae bacterium]|nr:AAA family ATPase [Streptosporangiaceae bacterium]
MTDRIVQDVRGNIGSPVRVDGSGTMRGREAEWRLVRDLLRRAQQGLGGVLLVDGEWGMGKSLLLHESRSEAAAQGFSLASGSAEQMGQLMPFAALLAALHQPYGRLAVEEDHRPDLPDSLHWQIAQLQASLEQRAAAAPVLVSLDDLQWASPATLLALRMLPRDLARYPLAWILARSSSQQEKGAGLLFDSLEEDGATRITLPPLRGDAVATLLSDTFGAPPDRGLLAQASGAAGNPSLLTELIRCLREENTVEVADGYARLMSAQLPRGIDRVARQGLDGLSGPARHLLETGAVQGRSFRLDETAEMLGVTPAALLPAVEEAVDAGILVASQDVFRFRRKLVWHAVVRMIPRPARRALHRQFGEILLSRGGSAAQAARHLLRAAHANDPSSLAGLDKAAGETLETSPQTAARLAQRAAELTDPADAGALPRAVAAAEALTAAGRLEQAARIVHDTLPQPLPLALEARLRCALSSIRCTSGSPQYASAEAEQVLAQAQLPAGLRDQAMIAQLQALAGRRDHKAADHAAAGILSARDKHADRVVAAALVVRATVSWDQGRTAEGLEYLREAARHDTVASPDARQFQPRLALAAGLVDLRRFDEAASVLRSADIEALDEIPSAAVPAILRARMQLARGCLRDATAEGEAALAIAGNLAAHGYTSIAHSVLAVIALRRGDLEAAAHHVASRSARAMHFADDYARAETTFADAQVSEMREGPGAALEQIRAICADLPARRGLLLGEPATSAWLVRSALIAGDHELAASVADVAEALARDNPGVPALAGAAAHTLGLVRRDTDLLAQAAARHQDPWARASAAEDLGVLLAERADQDRAVELMGEALDGYGTTGAAIDLARVRRRLRRLGVRRRHWARSAERASAGWDSLTETERVTSELVAQGLSNQQAADRMYVSVHTIAFHLRQIFRKLSIGSRVELARIVMEQQEHGSGLALAPA